MFRSARTGAIGVHLATAFQTPLFLLEGGAAWVAGSPGDDGVWALGDASQTPVLSAPQGRGAEPIPHGVA